MRILLVITFVCAALIPAYASAAVAPAPDAAPLVKRRTGLVSAALRKDLTTAVQYSVAAVLPQIPGLPVECVICDPSLLPKSKTIAKFLSVVPSARGIVARDDLNKRLVLGFSGTTDPVAALQDLDLFKEAWPTDVDGSRVHQGFLRSYQSVVDQFLPHVEAALEGDCKGYQVSVVGHSLGGAQALLAAVDLKRRHPDWNIKVYPSGKPRIGNEAWARYVNSLNLPIYRLTAKRDQVPRIPLRSWGFVHETGETWITPGGDWIQCDTFENGLGEDQSCIDSVPFGLTNWSDHAFAYPGTFDNK